LEHDLLLRRDQLDQERHIQWPLGTHTVHLYYEARSRVKNEIHAVLMRCLKDRPPAADLFGIKGRRWLAEQQLPVCERETVDAGLRQVDFLDTEIAQVDQLIAADALGWPDVKRLMTVPGVNAIVDATFMAAAGTPRSAFSRPRSSRTRHPQQRLRRSRQQQLPPPNHPVSTEAGELQHELALQAQRTYERTVKDRQQQRGASATPGRASRGSSSEQVARQTTGPKSAL
jgi:hypothetical protein